MEEYDYLSIAIVKDSGHAEHQNMMSEAAFWKIIDSSREKAKKKKRPPGRDFMDVHEETLAEALGELEPAAIVGFAQRFWTLHQKAYRWDLWGAAYWLGGGCSDDGFIDFRACLISLGKEAFQKILKNPDKIADYVDRPDMPYMQSEGFQYVASKTYKNATGKELPDLELEQAPIDPEGEQFDFDDEELMSEHYPKLVQKLPEGGD
jgi:uncharacterized protein DUF4240